MTKKVEKVETNVAVVATKLAQWSKLITLGNHRKTVSHKGQEGNASRPFFRMIENANNGKRLWDDTEPAKTCTQDCWYQYMGGVAPEGQDIEASAVLAGNCRLKTHADVVQLCKDKGIELSAAQLLIPVIDLTDRIQSRMDLVRIQVGDNEKDSGRIEVTQLEKLKLCIQEKPFGLAPTIEGDLKRKLEFERGDVQIFASIFKAFPIVKTLKKRLLTCTTDKKKLKELRYEENGPFPIHRWPRAKMVSLFAKHKKEKMSLSELASKIEDLLADVLTRGPAASKRLGIKHFSSAAEETPEGSVSHVLTECVENGDLAPLLAGLGPIWKDTPENSRNYYDLGLWWQTMLDKKDEGALNFLDRMILAEAKKQEAKEKQEA